MRDLSLEQDLNAMTRQGCLLNRVVVGESKRTGEDVLPDDDEWVEQQLMDGMEAAMDEEVEGDE